MFRRIIEGFTATHFTVIAGIAIIAPCTVAYGVVSYQPVAIVNANTGNKASVDTQGRLFTVDNIVDLPLAYAYSPANLVKIYGSCVNSSAGTTVYTPPSGKALIVKNANLTYYNGTSGSDNYAYLNADSHYIAGVESSDPVGNLSSDLGYYTSGALTLSCGPTGTFLAAVTGYLVPTSSLPPAAETAEHVAYSGPRVSKSGRPQ